MLGIDSESAALQEKVYFSSRQIDWIPVTIPAREVELNSVIVLCQ